MKKKPVLFIRKKLLKQELDTLYREYNNRDYVKFDPIKYVYEFEDEIEKELVGLICSSLSFGRVTQIFKAMESFLDIVSYKPLKYVLNLKDKPSKELLSFKYRFVKGLDVFNLLLSARNIIEEHGSLGRFARRNYRQGRFVELADKMIMEFKNTNYLIPSALKKSPCKRLFMYFRWMVREDNIDLGLWDFISPQELIIPLDTHIFRVANELSLTTKRTASLSAAIEITDNLKRYSKDDPVKYDWGLSHIGIIKNNFLLERPEFLNFDTPY